jgi:hypothetical protein
MDPSKIIDSPAEFVKVREQEQYLFAAKWFSNTLERSFVLFIAFRGL